jgi:hypothetical protein
MNADLRKRIDQLKSLALLRHLPEASLSRLQDKQALDSSL